MYKWHSESKSWKMFFFLIFLVISSFISGKLSFSEPTNVTMFDLSSSSTDESLDAAYWLSYAENLAKIMIQTANKTANGWYWRKDPTKPDDYYFSQIYPGYYFGAAGIGDQFLNLYRITGNQTYRSVAEKAADFVINQSIVFEGYLAWTRAVNAFTIYTGKKYGYAGIIPFLLNLYRETNNETYLKVAEEGIKGLLHLAIYDNQSAGLSWGYNFNTKDSLTDLTYGAAGIGEAFLTMYQSSGNNSYLQAAILAANWILSQTVQEKGPNFVFYSVYASPIPDYHYTYTGFSAGSTGIGKFFLDLFDITQNQTYLDIAVAIGRWLVISMKNGLWELGAPDLLTDAFNTDGTFLGYAAGSAGIGIYLLDLFNKTQDTTFLYPIKKIIDMYYEQAIHNGSQIYWTVQKHGYFENRVASGLAFGVAGIGLFYSKLIVFFGNYKNSFAMLTGIDTFVRVNQNVNTGFILESIQPVGTTQEYHTDYFIGLAGILSTYSDIYTSLVSNQSKYQQGLIDTASANHLFTDYSQISHVDTTTINSDTISPSSSGITNLLGEPLNKEIMLLFSWFLLIIAVKRKRKQNNN